MVELLSKIRSSLYGREIREPVAKALQCVYDKLVIPVSNAEAVEARGTYSRLYERTDANKVQIDTAKEKVDLIKTVFKLTVGRE